MAGYYGIPLVSVCLSRVCLSTLCFGIAPPSSPLIKLKLGGQLDYEVIQCILF